MKSEVKTRALNLIGAIGIILCVVLVLLSNSSITYGSEPIQKQIVLSNNQNTEIAEIFADDAEGRLRAFPGLKTRKNSVETIISLLAEYYANQLIDVQLSPPVEMNEKVRFELSKRSDAITQMKQRIGASFVDVQFSFSVDNGKFEGTGYRTSFTEEFKVFYQYPDDSSINELVFSAKHDVRFDESNCLIEDVFDETFSTGYTSSGADSIPDGMPIEYKKQVAERERADSLPLLRFTQSNYNATAAINYSNTYALSNNPIYPSYNGSGVSDCANYVSQCLHAGGIAYIGVNNYLNGWYAVTAPSTPDSSYPWCNVDGFVSFWNNHGYSSVAANGSNSNLANCIPGNPIYWLNGPGSSFSGHLMLCVGYDSMAIPVINAHSNTIGQYVSSMPISNYSSHVLYTFLFKTCSHTTSITYTHKTLQSHVRNCGACGNKKIEAHSWVTHSTYIQCSKCGYIQYIQ